MRSARAKAVRRSGRTGLHGTSSAERAAIHYGPVRKGSALVSNQGLPHPARPDRAVGRSRARARGLPAPAPAAAPPIRLVLFIAVDQLRPDRLDPALPGGLGRLAREGRVFVDGALAHGMTETCPGHATMLTGRHPAAAGIPANDFFDPRRAPRATAPRTPTPATREIGGRGGLSPAKLRVSALGDWLKRRARRAASSRCRARTAARSCWAA